MEIKDRRHKSALFYFKGTLSVLIIAAIFLFFGIGLYKSWGDFIYSEFSWLYASISIAFALVSIIFMAFVYFLILRAMKFNVQLGEAINSHIMGDFASYLPGKVWNVFVRWKTLKGKVRLADSFAAIYLEALLQILASVVIIIILGFLFGNGFTGKYALVFYLAIPFVMVLAHPKIMGFCINLVLKILKKKQVKILISMKDILSLSLLCIIYWAFNGLAMFFAIRSIYPATYNLLPAVIIANTSSWVIGLVSALTPAGLGIKEGITVLLLSPYIPNPVLIASSVLFRILWMIILLIASAVSVYSILKSVKLKSIKSYFRGEENEENEET